MHLRSYFRPGDAHLLTTYNICLSENWFKDLVVSTGWLWLLAVCGYEPAASQWLQRFQLYKDAITDLVWPALHLPDLCRTNHSQYLMQA